MAQLGDLVASITNGRVEIIDLTNKLTENTPSMTLPDPFPSPAGFELTEVAAYDERGPLWRANDILIGEHTGTHLDVPVHWITGRDGRDVSETPLPRLVGPAVVVDFAAEAAADPDFLVGVEHLKKWQAEHGDFPRNGWLLFRTGWAVHSQNAEKFINADSEGAHSPGFTPECARWLAEETEISGVGVETIGLDAGLAGGMEPAMPMHYYLLGNDKYGITSLQNLDRLPVTGAVIVVAPLPIVGGTGSPTRVLALVERD